MTLIHLQYSLSDYENYKQTPATSDVTFGCYENMQLQIRFPVNIKFPLHRSRDISVGLTTDYGLDRRSSTPGKSFLYSTTSRPVLGFTQLPIQWTQGLFPWG